MKTLKKLLKLIALVGIVVGVIKSVTRILNVISRVRDYEHNAVGGTVNKTFEDEVIDQKSIGLMCSSGKLDFNKSTLNNDSATLNVMARCSALQVKVPEHWQVALDGVDVQSAISKRFIDNENVVDAPVLNINYDLKYSALDIINCKEELPMEEEEEVIEEVIEEVEEQEMEEPLVINDDEDTL